LADVNVLAVSMVLLSLNKKKRTVLAWLLLSSSATSVALWTAIMVGLSAMRFPALPDSATFSFQPIPTFLSLGIAVPLSFIGYAIVIKSTK
jgi:NO-binding membrane sensor protein with MHYT domain